MFEKTFPQYYKMMKLSRGEILKELYSKLNKLITKKTRIEEEEKEERRGERRGKKKLDPLT